jgi:hypothetical protein
MIAFTRRRPDGDVIMILDLESRAETLLETDFPCSWPSWSPDGADLVCAARIQGQLDLMRVKLEELDVGGRTGGH